MRPLVGVILGSMSDLPVMKEAAGLLKEFGVPHEVNVVSAHRTPELAYAYAKGARKRGLEVLIAGAGGAAHLAGVTAALTTLPVIGVPIETKVLGGLDSLLSTVQMPSGVPVATVGIGGAKNAALLAARILALRRPELARALKRYAQARAAEIRRAKVQPTVLKKSFPLSSIRMKAGKSATSMLQTASIPSSGYSRTSTRLMYLRARRAAGPPIEPR